MSCRTGPCCLVSYKRMEEKNVMPDRTLLLDHTQENEGKGCRTGQDLVAWFPTKEWRKRMSCRTGPCCLVSYRRMGEKDVTLDRTLLSED